jgi:hypothetical protein
MGQPTWNTIATVTIPTPATSFWTAALDYLTAGKLYKITVEMKQDPDDAAKKIDQKWTPESGKPCTADGDPTMVRKGSLTIDGCAVGTLIAKVGGSAADLEPDKAKTVLFPVGRHCVFSIAEPTKCGSLYLGMNDAQANLTKIDGGLEVTVFEAL